jgi:micrococcal nuclease
MTTHPGGRHTGVRRVWILFALGLGAVACTDEPAQPIGPVEANAAIVFVIDGDTVIATFEGREETVRLIGIDTPETKKQNAPIECYGPEASAYTSSLLPKGTPVRIERDVEARDDYGRLLGYVYRAQDGLFVNLDLVAQGYAEVLSIRPNTTYRDDFVEAARAAERANLGLWGACPG